jgi:hypothetical protein
MAIPERREAVAELAAEGHTQPEIAAIVGASQPTVSRDLQPDPQVSEPQPEIQYSDECDDQGDTSDPQVSEPQPEIQYSDECELDRYAEPWDDAPPRQSEPEAQRDPEPPGHIEQAEPADDEDVTPAVSDWIEDDPSIARGRWNTAFMGQIVRTKSVFAYTPQDVAENADEQCTTELRRAASELADYVRRVDLARSPLRAVK